MSTTLRPYQPADEAFVFSGWKKSFRCSDAAGPYPPDLYREVANETIRLLIERPGVEVLVVADDDPASDVLYGFLAHEREWSRWSKKRKRLETWHVVHYAYVPELARGKGVARRLLEAAGVRRDSPTTAYSFETPATRGLLGQRAKHIPDAARYESRPAKEAKPA